MKEQLFILLQKILPQHGLSWFSGYIANSKISWLKNTLIYLFIWWYKIDLSSAIVKDPKAFSCFNDFFTRKLDMQYRPLQDLGNMITSPADGYISQIGQIHEQQLLQAKGQYYSLDSLLAGQHVASFKNGYFSTIYLAPHNYHRVHTPISGALKKTIFIPGKLYSVNQTTAENIPDLFQLNERLVCIFDTDIGEVAVILVGALIVGSIQLSWMDDAIKHLEVTINEFKNPVHLKQGEELAAFKLGSTVIMLLPASNLTWSSKISSKSTVYVRETLGIF